MRTVARLVIALLILAGAGVAGAQPAATDRVEELKREFAYAQGVKTDLGGAANGPTAEKDAERYHEFRMEQQRNKVIFAAILAALALSAHLLVLRCLPRTEDSATHVVGATGLVYIVFGTIILVVIATTEAQLTAAMGILGAVAGYLFGRLRRDDPQQDNAGAER
jgi:hypothetical protein